MYKYKLENIDVNDNKAQIFNIQVQNNDYIKKDDHICDVETTKVNIEINAKKEGYIELLFDEGDYIEFGEVLYVIKENKDEKIKLKQEEKNHKKEEYILTKKAENYLKRNNLDIDKYRNKLKNKPIIKFKDLQKIFEDSEKGIIEGASKRFGTLNNRTKVVIIGGGTSGEVVADILFDQKKYEVVGFVDDNPKENFEFYGKKIIYDDIRKFPTEYDKNKYDAVIISFGGNLSIKKEIYNLYKEHNISFINAIDKTAKIGRNVKLGEGNVIGANTYIGTSTEIKNNNWVAASVNIDHHNNIGNHNLFGPNFTSPGKVKIGNLNMFGANSSLNNNVIIGDNNKIMNNVSIYRQIKDNNIIKNEVK